MTDIRKRWSARFSTRFGAIPYRYALAPLVWDTSVPSLQHWRFPDTTQGGIDLRPLPAQAIAGGAPQGLAFVAATQPVSGSEITRAMYVDEAATTVMRNAWQANMGYRPAGDQLRDMLWDQLTAGADPTGDAGPKPLMPTANGQLELWLGGHSLIKREPFRWGQHPHTNRVQAVLQRDFERMWEETNGDDQCRRVLDYHCRQYRVDDWQEFVPQRLRSHVPGRLPHATTITDNFNRANSGTVGSSSEGWSWTELGSGQWSISSNTLAKSGASAEGVRAQSDLSSANNYAQVKHLSSTGANSYCGPAARFSASAATTYVATFRTAGGGREVIYKIVSGAQTAIAGENTNALANNDTVRTTANGSSISGQINGATVIAVTDTAITGHVRTGCYSLDDGAVGYDDFVGSDIAAAGHPAMRRWGMSRGGIFRPVELGREGVQVI